MTRARTLLLIGVTLLAAAFGVAGCSSGGLVKGAAMAGQSPTPRASGAGTPSGGGTASASAPAAPSTSQKAVVTPTPPPATALRPGVSDKDLVQQLVVPPEKLVSGWEMQLTQGGDGLRVNTLDLCGAPYPSEALRTARRQVQYGPDTDDLSISNEIVTYKTGGAVQALKEVQQAVATCPGGEVQERDLRGGMAIYHVQKLLVTGSKWLPGTLAYYVEIDHPDDGTTFTECEIFQSRANVVDIVYGDMNGQEVSGPTMALANAVADALSVSSDDV